MKSRIYLALASLALLLLTACGGGGGGGSPATPPTTYTTAKTCWDGTRPTSTVSQADADSKVPAQCPALPASSYAATTVTVGTSTLTMSISGLPAGFTGGTLTATGQASGGTWDITVSASGVITFTPRTGAILAWNTTYSGTLAMDFTNAPSVTKTVTFTTGIIPCTAPKVPDASGNNCVDPTPTFAWPTDVKTLMEPGIVNGVLVSSALAVRNWLALNPVTNIVGDAAWNANLANGNVQIVKSGEMAPDINGVQRNIWRAVYSMVRPGNTNRINCMSPIYADTGLSYVNDNAVGTSCNLGEANAYVVGVSDAANPQNNGNIFRGGVGSNIPNNCYLLTVLGNPGSVACPF